MRLGLAFGTVGTVVTVGTVGTVGTIGTIGTAEMASLWSAAFTVRGVHRSLKRVAA